MQLGPLSRTEVESLTAFWKPPSDSEFINYMYFCGVQGKATAKVHWAFTVRAKYLALFLSFWQHFYDTGTSFNTRFINGATEEQNGYVTCPESHSWQAVQSGLEPRLAVEKVLIITLYCLQDFNT